MILKDYTLFNAIPGWTCAAIWICLAFRDGLDALRIAVIALWLFSGTLNTYAHMKNRKQEKEKYNG